MQCITFGVRGGGEELEEEQEERNPARQHDALADEERGFGSKERGGEGRGEAERG